MNKLISLTVFIFTSSLVLLGAGFSVNKSLEGDTNVVLIARVIKQSKSSTALALGKNSPQVLSSTTENQCKNIITIKNEENSIVDALATNGVRSTFSARINLAKKLNITNYTGSSEQNLKILSIIKDNKICIDKLVENI